MINEIFHCLLNASLNECVLFRLVITSGSCFDHDFCMPNRTTTTGFFIISYQRCVLYTVRVGRLSFYGFELIPYVQYGGFKKKFFGFLDSIQVSSFRMCNVSLKLIPAPVMTVVYVLITRSLRSIRKTEANPPFCQPTANQ